MSEKELFDFNRVRPVIKKSKDMYFPAVDIVRFICSFFIIAIHVTPFTDMNKYLANGICNYIARLAVPFFFVAGGYFCFGKTDTQNIECGIPVSYAKRMLKLYLFWTVIGSV